MKIIARNKKAFHDYQILERMEAGIVLSGDEVKSLRAGKVSLIGAFAVFKQGELYLINCLITPYDKAFDKKTEDEGRRARKLLLHKKELSKLIGQTAQKGVTLIPLSLYFNKKNLVKVEVGIGKHKKAQGKKQELKERDIKRQTRRELKGSY